MNDSPKDDLGGAQLSGGLAGASLHMEQPQEPYRADPPTTH